MSWSSNRRGCSLWPAVGLQMMMTKCVPYSVYMAYVPSYLCVCLLYYIIHYTLNNLVASHAAELAELRVHGVQCVHVHVTSLVTQSTHTHTLNYTRSADCGKLKERCRRGTGLNSWQGACFLMQIVCWRSEYGQYYICHLVAMFTTLYMYPSCSVFRAGHPVCLLTVTQFCIRTYTFI